MYVTALEVDFEDRQRSRKNWRLSSQQSVPYSSAEESAVQSDAPSDSSRRRRRRSRSRTPSLFGDAAEGDSHYRIIMRSVLPWYSLVLCYLGCVMLRLPVFIRDLQRWATSGAMPFFFTAADLPEELTSRFDLFRSGIERKVKQQTVYMVLRRASANH